MFRAIRLTVVAVTLFAALAAPARPQAEEAAKGSTKPSAVKGFDFPSNRSGEVAEAFITTFNSGDSTSVSGFLADFCSEARRPELEKELWAYGRLYELLGALTPYSIAESSANSIVVLVRSDNVGSYFNVGITLDDGTPAMVVEHFIRPAAPPKS